LEEGGLVMLGRGASTDIIEASAKAYLNAINKLSLAKRRRAKGS
jgi:2-isopropylmalate synthase